MPSSAPENAQVSRSRSPARNAAGKPRGRPKGLTPAAKRARDRRLVRDRVVEGLSWSSLALKYDLDASSCRRIVTAWRKENRSLDEIDATVEVEEAIQSYEAQIERLQAIRMKAIDAERWNAVLGAERQITKVTQAKLNLMQQANLVPKELGTLKHVVETREVVQKVVLVIDRIESGEVKPADARRELIAMLGPPPSPN
jgi:hypothetical protein